MPRLAEAMLRFIDEPGLIAAMGAPRQRLAEERFDVRRINATILADLGIAAPGAGRGPQAFVSGDERG